MRKLLLSIACALAIGVVAGCGGGGGGTAGPSVSYKTASELPSIPQGDAFVAGAVCGPTGVTFAQPVTLTFTLSTPLAQGAVVTLAGFDGQNWTNIRNTTVNISQDRRTLTVDVSQFTYSNYAIFKS